MQHFLSTILPLLALPVLPWSVKSLETVVRHHPGILTTSVHPGPNLWIGESVALECRLSHAHPKATVVWHRVLLDPAGRKLRSLGLDDLVEKDMEIIIVRERTAELISHGDLLLMSDPRFLLKVHRSNNSVVYRLELSNARLEDSGDYECQVTSPTENELESNPQKVLNQRVEINVFQRHVSKEENIYSQDSKRKKNVSTPKPDQPMPKTMDPVSGSSNAHDSPSERNVLSGSLQNDGTMPQVEPKEV
eukprot:maker-scaffold580_size130538-snap-gene-0.25 protein:Tk07482 transcript:maker-scaffold580_size130538-snap-gene-0.25-mRNA-1 annotation:"lachesin"